MGRSNKWGYIRIITGTLVGGSLGFYAMNNLETSYKGKMKENLRKYEMEKMKIEKLGEFVDESQ